MSSDIKTALLALIAAAAFIGAAVISVTPSRAIEPGQLQDQGRYSPAHFRVKPVAQ